MQLKKFQKKIGWEPLDDWLGTTVVTRLRTDDREISGSLGNFLFSDTQGTASKQ